MIQIKKNFENFLKEKERTELRKLLGLFEYTFEEY